MKYEETFIAFADFLGFSEASTELDDSARQEVLGLLQNLAALRSEFEAALIDATNIGARYSIKPAVSTFSDHIVISYGLETLRNTTPLNEETIAIAILAQIVKLISTIAAEALRLGFLIRGAATIGKLYHANGVVFGEALIEATQLEARTAVYPRIVLSSAVCARTDWKNTLHVTRYDDGIYCLDYFEAMLLSAAPQGNDWAANVKQWFDEIAIVVKTNLENLESQGKLNELAKWTWFAKRFRAVLSGLPPILIEKIGITLDAIPWGL